MPELINSILKEFPDCIISLEDSKDENSLFAMLENNEIDVMIGSPHQNTIKYKSQFITNELLILAVPKSFRFSRQSRTPLFKKDFPEPAFSAES